MSDVLLSQRRSPRFALRARPAALCWRAAVAAGLAAGAALLAVLILLGVVIYDESPWKFLRMMAATVRGDGAFDADGSFDLAIVTTGLLAHFALSLAFAFALAGLLADFRRWFAPWVGLAFGIALYFMVFHGATQAFGWFAELRTPDTFLAYGVYGLLLARAYRAFASSLQ